MQDRLLYREKSLLQKPVKIAAGQKSLLLRILIVDFAFWGLQTLYFMVSDEPGFSQVRGVYLTEKHLLIDGSDVLLSVAWWKFGNTSLFLAQI